MGLPDVNMVTVIKAQVDKTIKEYNKQEIREVMAKKYKKLDELVEGEDGFIKEYLRIKNMISVVVDYLQIIVFFGVDVCNDVFSLTIHI